MHTEGANSLKVLLYLQGVIKTTEDEAVSRKLKSEEETESNTFNHKQRLL